MWDSEQHCYRREWPRNKFHNWPHRLNTLRLPVLRKGIPTTFLPQKARTGMNIFISIVWTLSVYPRPQVYLKSSINLKSKRQPGKRSHCTRITKKIEYNLSHYSFLSIHVESNLHMKIIPYQKRDTQSQIWRWSTKDNPASHKKRWGVFVPEIRNVRTNTRFS